MMRGEAMIKYLPTYMGATIYDLDFAKLYALHKKNIIMDLDNTLIPYTKCEADDALLKWHKRLKELGFHLYIASNNNDQRIVQFSKTFPLDGFLTKAGKPKADKLLAFMEEHHLKASETIMLGDQILTDIAVANNAGIDSILVTSIDKTSQKWYTKINRIRERKIIKKLYDEDPIKAKELENIIGG